jgi:Domain of unknown function (DUF4421)
MRFKLFTHILLPALFLIFPFSLKAQFSTLFSKDTVNPKYIETMDTLANTRLYVSQKLTWPTLISPDGDHMVKYRSNGPTNLGFGGTYGWLTLNIGLNFKAINHDNDIYGESRFLDLHGSGIGKTYFIDFFGQFYKGVYLMPESGKSLPDGVPYPTRPDITTQQVGLTAWYIPNWRRYSYAAAANQRDWQKKSAGSFLLGWGFFTGKIQGDSSLIPADRSAYFPHPGIDKVSFFELSAGVGYGYTLVIRKHFFAAASFTASLSGGVSHQFEGERESNDVYFKPNYLFRPSIGYNGPNFNASVMLFAYQLNAGEETSYRITTTNLRFTVAHRLVPRAKSKKLLTKLMNVNPWWKRQHNQ